VSEAKGVTPFLNRDRLVVMILNGEWDSTSIKFEN